MMDKQKHIEEFGLSGLAKSGVYIVNMRDVLSADSHDTSEPHRDNHYLLILATKGRYVLNLDFNEVIIDSPALVFVAPSQVHQMMDMKAPEGWILNFDPAILDVELQQIFENKLTSFMNLEDDFELQNRLSNTLNLIEDLQAGSNNTFVSKSVHALLIALCGIVAGKLLSQSVGLQAAEGRNYEIKLSFITLLKKHYKEWKEPAQYASALSITVTYLNFCVKKVTGMPVSQHIQQHSILEAKRLLYYTNLNAREIGYDVGYYEPVYFGKLFKKLTGITPLQFRQRYRN